MNACLKWIVLAAVAPAVSGCSTGEKPATDRMPQIYTTFYPTTYFTQRIGGDRVEVVCPLPEDADPIFWKPPAATIEAYQQADLIVINGAGFERWVKRVSLPSSILVDTAEPLKESFLKFAGAATHSHGNDDHHSHEGIDGHTWLDPAHAKVQAEEICKALQSLLPECADEFQASYTALAADLDAIDQSLGKLSAAMGDEHLLASHPAYNYLVERYGWNLTSLDLDPSSMPTDAQFAEIKDGLASKPAGVILWESTPADEIAERFKSELGLTSVTFSPCEQLDEASQAAGKDYVAVMGENIASLKGELKP